MPSRDVHVRHLFDGGWAPALGPFSGASLTTSYNLAATGAEQSVNFPFLVECEDCIYEMDGGPHAAPGTIKLNSSALESGAAIDGIFDYWNIGTAGTPAQHRIIHIGTKIKKDNANGTFTDLFTGMTAGGTPCYRVLEDLLVISSNSGDVPKSWDGTTAQSLAGTPPAFQFSEVHKQYLFAAGAPSAPSRLYYCVPLTPADWTSLGSGYFDIDPSDGDVITGLASHKDSLLIFKGPNKGSIHRLLGSSATSTSDPFSIQAFSRGLGAINHASIFRFGDDLGFISPEGLVRSVSATASYGDFISATLSHDIHSWVRDHVNMVQLKRAQAVNWPEYGIVLFSLPVDGSATNNHILMMDYRFKNGARWGSWPSFGSAGVSLGLVKDTANSRQLVMGGGDDGYVRKFGQPARSIDGATSLAPKITTPFMSYQSDLNMKTLVAVGVGIAPHNNADFTFGWTRDANAQQSTTMTQTGGDVLGPASANEFTLGTSVLAGTNYAPLFAQLEEGGEFRSIQYQIKQSANDADLEIHQISAQITLGGVSTEA